MQELREIRALFDARTITVYQAYGHAIADAALTAGHFVAPFSYERMTWVKPSFLWMMERCGWATKANQERVLAVRVSRERFEHALSLAVQTSPAKGVSADAWEAQLRGSPIRVQWDPERDVRGTKLAHRSLQLGLGRPICRAYATEWIERIEDLTPLVKKLRALRREGAWAQVERPLPSERAYSVRSD